MGMCMAPLKGRYSASGWYATCLENKSLSACRVMKKSIREARYPLQNVGGAAAFQLFRTVRSKRWRSSWKIFASECCLPVCFALHHLKWVVPTWCPSCWREQLKSPAISSEFRLGTLSKPCCRVDQKGNVVASWWDFCCQRIDNSKKGQKIELENEF